MADTETKPVDYREAKVCFHCSKPVGQFDWLISGDKRLLHMTACHYQYWKGVMDDERKQRG